MKKMSDRDGDIPKTVAVIMTTIPTLVLRTGITYLRTKRKARKNAKRVLKGMVENGVPREYAKKLAEAYDSGLRLRSVVSTFGAGRWRS